MRLICPNCGAQYEVADDVIPENGRDVQCSNCGHTWFENPGASAAAEAEMSEQWDEAAPDDMMDEPEPEPEPEPELEPEPEPEPEDEPEPEPDVEVTAEAVDWESYEPEDDDEDDTPDDALTPGADETAAAIGAILGQERGVEDRVTPAPQPGGSPTAAPRRPALDPSVAEILREEAAREEAARAAERNTGLEQQEDLGLDAAEPEDARDREARERIARLKGEAPDVAAAVAATVASSRKELLPDIDEINSTLRSSSDRPENDPLPEEVAEQERRGFRFGFVSVLMLIIVLALIYIFADLIAAQVPALAGVLESYVEMIDALRIWVDVQIQGLLTSLEGTEAAAPDAAPVSGDATEAPAAPAAPEVDAEASTGN